LTPEEIKEEKYKNLAAIGPQHTTQPLQNENGSDWGKTPNWIPRYPGAAIPYGSMHAPLKDGSIWGNITITHSDSEDLIVEFLKREFLEQGFKLTANVKRKGSSYVVFKRLKEGEEKRHVTCTLSESGGKTRVSIQYSYGMP
ncbi:MAG: hypothetical protein KJO79_00285, partial [Verrucomicrobiae bacterium]|nr:hypothetical protein [Verrucomicrobiae bacterium]NNJ85582.1 hypothetical protein [Akkermansiaceae bacterium]